MRTSQIVPIGRAEASPPTSGPSVIMLTTNRPAQGEPSATRSSVMRR